MNGKYHVLYRMEAKPLGITKDEISGVDGASDCLVVHSVMGVPGSPGGLSVATLSLNGTTGEELTPDQLFVVWSLFTNMLAGKLEPGWKRDLTSSAFETVRYVLTGKVPDDEGSKGKKHQA